MSKALAEGFLEPEIAVHSGGHYLPASSLQKKVYQDFIKAMHETNLDRAESI